MPYLVLALIGFIAFLLQVGIGTVIVYFIASLVGASVTYGAAFGIALAIILLKNLLASAVRGE